MIAVESVNIASHLSRMADRRPDQPAVLRPRTSAARPEYDRLTYQQLNDWSDALAAGLADIGIGPGTKTVLMVPPSAEFFALTFALFKAGAVPVLVDPGMGIRNLGQCLREAAPEAFVAVTKAHVARVLLGWARDTIRTCVTVGPRLGWSGWSLAEIDQRGRESGPSPTAEPDPNEMAAILFTSGSTGPPKGAVYSHAIFQAQVDLLKRLYGIEPGEIDLCTFPLFALFAPALGMTAVVPVMDATRPAQVDPRNIVGPIQQLGVTNMFGSPALIRRVGAYGRKYGVRLPSLRRVVSAGAPVYGPVLEQFASMLAPGVQIFTPYGATESLPVASIGSDEIIGETHATTRTGAGVCVGTPVPDVDVRIIRITDAPIPSWQPDLALPAGEIGEITVSGPVVTPAYYNRPESTALAKIDDAGRVWHRMGDVGYFDAAGRLWFCGRKAHRVVTRSATLFTIPCEAVFNEHPDVQRTALVGVGPPGEQTPVLCVELKRRQRRAAVRRILAELAELAHSQPHTRGIATFLIHKSFPVDVRHNSKIFREKLAVWASGRLGRRAGP